MEQPDPNHPLVAASTFLDQLKFPAPGGEEGPTEIMVKHEDFVERFDMLLREISMVNHGLLVADLDSAEILDDCNYFGLAIEYQSEGRISMMDGKSVFLDGLMHGLALAAGLRPE